MQGMELGLQTLAAGGAIMVGTLQGGKRETTRFEPERDDAWSMTDKPAFDAFLGGVRKQSAFPLSFLHGATSHSQGSSCLADRDVYAGSCLS